MRSARILVFTALLVCCTPIDPQLRGCPRLARTYFVEHVGSDTTEYVKLDLDSQYEIFLCARQYMHPPRSEFAQALALQGERTVPFLTQKLAVSSNDRTTKDIIFVFSIMSLRDAYDVRANLELMTLLRRKARSIRDRDWQQEVGGWVDDIERGRIAP